MWPNRNFLDCVRCRNSYLRRRRTFQVIQGLIILPFWVLHIILRKEMLYYFNAISNSVYVIEAHKVRAKTKIIHQRFFGRGRLYEWLYFIKSTAVWGWVHILVTIKWWSPPSLLACLTSDVTCLQFQFHIVFWAICRVWLVRRAPWSCQPLDLWQHRVLGTRT